MSPMFKPPQPSDDPFDDTKHLLDESIYAYKGEQVTCNGVDNHLICVFARDVRRNEVITSEMFENWHSKVPHRAGDKFGMCPECGCAWNMAGKHGRGPGYLWITSPPATEGGWRR